MARNFEDVFIAITMVTEQFLHIIDACIARQDPIT